MLSHLLLIACICIVIALVLYFFYWNRFVAAVIGQAFRIFYWNQEGSSIWVEIGSIHFSLLAGRILLKDVRYHSSNQTFKIVRAQIQWKYWIRRPMSEEELGEDGETYVHSVELSERFSSCRIQLSFQGVEWLLYNRTSAYDNIVAQMEKATRSSSRSSSHFHFFRRFARHNDTSHGYPPAPRAALRMPSFVGEGLAWLGKQMPSFDPQDLLPLGIRIQTGAIILGNASTPQLLVAEFRNTLGTYGIVPSRSRHDLYKQVLNLHFQFALIHLVDNNNFIDPMSTLGGLVHNRAQSQSTRRPFYHSYRIFTRLWRQLGLERLVADYFSVRQAQRLAHKSLASSLPGFKNSRPVEEETPVGIDFSTHEYAVDCKILDTSHLELTYYVDVVGEVPTDVPAVDSQTGPYDIGNGDTDPEWGFDLVIYGGFLRYGPWADRQRVELQHTFFPPTFQDHEVTPYLKPGDKRLWTTLKIFVELRGETSLHIPFREPSKDWQWDGITNIPHRPRKREPAFLSITIGDRSSINYTVPMVTGPSGYESALKADLDTITATSSLNDIRLIVAESAQIRGILPVPIRWNGERTWTFTVYLRQTTLYLLRDHINMFTDLGRDWTSGPPTDYQKFIPMIYAFQLEMRHYELNLYVNDHNIIDKPLIREENALLTLQGPALKIAVTIPTNIFRSESTSIPFGVSASDLLGNFSLPRWSTHALHTQKEDISLFKTTSLKIDGSYRFFAEVREEHVEKLKLGIDLNNTVLRAFGWAIRYFLVLRENYFGSFTQFQTLSEYLEKKQNNLPISDPLKLKYRPGKSNMLEVELFVRAERSTVLLPTTLVGSPTHTFDDPNTFRRAVSLVVPEIQLQLRLHDYYMEISLNCDRITGSVFQDAAGQASHAQEILIIDGIDIIANRLFGPQPRTAVYVCIWEVALGDVKASMSASQMGLLSAAGSAFGYNLVDLANAPANNLAVVLDPDVTFYKITVKTVDATWRTGQAALLLQFSKGVKLDRNDLGTSQYKKVSCLRIPDVSLKVLLTGNLRRREWLEAAEIAAEAYLDIYSSPNDHLSLTRAQLAFIEEQDEYTGRARRLFEQLNGTQRLKSRSDHTTYRNGIYIPQPALPHRTSNQERFGHKPHGHNPPPSWRLSTLVNVSDTDAEEGVSEADRDARLARTRTSTPVLQLPDDDVAMSSGDESDDADLTDGNSSEDDWSDLNESSQELASLMSFYSPIVRHYVANSSAESGFWDGFLFSPTRESAAFMRRGQPIAEIRNYSDSAVLNLPNIIPGEDVTTFRLKCQTISLTFTPLVIEACLRLEDDFKTMEPAEICLDSMLGDCISKIFAKNVQNCFIVDIDVSHVSFHAIQHIAMLDANHPNIFKAKGGVSFPTNLDILSILHSRAAGLRLAGVFRRNCPVVTVSLCEFSGSFETSVDKRTLRVTQDKCLDVVFSSSSINLSHTGFRADFERISVDIGHLGPELVTATSLAMASSASSIFQVAQRVQVHKVRRQRLIVADILKISQEHPVIDPWSTIQPSYLVQSGLPQLLRSHISFRFLYHLRSCLSPQRSIQQLPTDVDLEELKSLIETRLTHLEPRASNIDNLTSMGSFFLESKPPSSMQLLSHICMLPTFGVRLGSLRVAVTAPSATPSSELAIENFEIDMQFKKQDIVQFNLNNPSSASQTSLRTRSPKVVRKTAVVMSFGNVTLIVVPHLMNFAQNILRVKKHVADNTNDGLFRKRMPVDSTEKPASKIAHTEVIGIIHQLRIQAAAENLVLVMGLNGVRTATSLLTMQNRSLSVNCTVLFKEVYLQARSPSNPSKDSDHDVLAALSFANGRSSGVSKPDARSRTNLKLVLSMTSIKLHVPRSALRLYHFIEEWRQDYLPGLETTLKTLLSEYQASPSRPLLTPTVSNQAHRGLLIQLHGEITHIEVSLQVMHGTWLLWEMHKSVAYVENSGTLASSNHHAFGIQVGSMVLNISSKPNAIDAAPSSRVKVPLPPISVAGHSEGSQIHMLVLLEFMDLKVKPSHWDTLLAVQQKFGQDFNDLLVLMQKTRHKALPDKTPAARKKVLQYVAHVRMQGFRIGLVGLSSTIFLDCQDISGGFTGTDGWAWDLGLSDLALSLAPRGSGTQSTSFNRKQRSAFVIIDVNLSGASPEGRRDKNLRLSVSKIHAVMQPSSMGEFGDFMDNLQAEMLERQEQRALQLAAFKVKAESILQTFGVNVGDVQLEKVSWLDDMFISISIQNIGVAFPLTHNEDLQIPRNKSKESTAVRAFLFCIKSIDFIANRGETGQATMRCLSSQFVSKFRQSASEDFTAEKHQTRNRLLYPDMRAQLRASTMGSSRKVWIKADVSGFVLDIDSTIPNYVFSLIDVYRQGKERVERLSSIAPRTPLSAFPIVETAKPSLEKHYTDLPTSNVFAQLTFLSGKVRFYSAAASNEFKNRTFAQTLLDVSDDQVLDLGAEVFNLPVVSVWAEYRATPASQKLAKDLESEPSLLVFKSTVFSSQNALRPTLLPFLTELVSRIETRMRKVSALAPPPPSVPSSLDKNRDMDIVSSMKISFSLRIDKSMLELTCQPDVNVVAGLNWESGGFIVNVSPGARKVFFSGTVGGLTIGLKHGFLSEDCVKLDARNLTFSVSFTKTELNDRKSVNSVAVVLDTEFHGGVRFSRLQDILCFKAVWLDRIPVLDSQMGPEIKTPIKSSVAEHPPSSRGFSTAILLRVRQISLQVDLGQSVSKVNLDLNDTIFRTTLADDCNEVFLYIANISTFAHGNLSGRAGVSSCVFQTIRYSEESLHEDEGKSCMLELRLTSGALIADFESDLQNLLHYRAEPLKLEIFDDWSQTQASISDKTRPVHLSFTITCPEIVAVITVSTIPKLLSYMNKFQANLGIQRQGAYRESQMFRVTWTPKPDNPLSAVGEAMLHSARNRFKEVGISLVVRQHMRLRLDLLRLVVFPRTMRDLEIAQFIGHDITARLDGLAVSDSPSAERELRLSFSSMVISKYNRSRPVHQRFERPDDDGKEWLTTLLKDASEANIVGLPSMKMQMISEESAGDFARVLTYDFFSEFVLREGMKAFEDIYITLNMSLYAWLTVLRKNLTREMDQVKASEGWRSSIGSSSTGISTVPPRKKKVPDPLPLGDQTTRFSTSPTQSGALSYSGPPSAISARESLVSPTSLLSLSVQFPVTREGAEDSPISQAPPKKKALIYSHRNRHIERLTMRQLGEATPDVMHPFFMKKAGFSLEDSLPQYLHEYATSPLEEILGVLLKLYSKQLLAGRSSRSSDDPPNVSM